MCAWRNSVDVTYAWGLEPGRQCGAEGGGVRRSGTPSSRPQREALRIGRAGDGAVPLRPALAIEPTPQSQATKNGQVAKVSGRLRLLRSL